MKAPYYLNDGSQDEPKLKVYLNLDNMIDLPDHSIAHGLSADDALKRILNDGFEGVQLGETQSVSDTVEIPYCGLDRINKPEEAEAVFARHKARGDTCISLHVGWGIEDDATVDRLVESVLNASAKHELPAFIETHRATITQDMWRTVELTKRFPEVRFNGDFSHYYCGQEMVYGGVEMKLEFMQPIFDRIGFMHGRIAAPGYMQAPIDDTQSRPGMAVGADYFEHFREMWRLAMGGFKKNAPKGSVLIFAPELLSPVIYYARVFKDGSGELREESDRYAQALLYKDVARACFAQA